jgi:hypothetical protein
MRESQVAGRSGDEDGPETVPRYTWGLAERIAALPGLTAQYTSLADGTTASDHFVDSAYVLRSPCIQPQLLCHIDFEGILVPKLGPLDIAEVVHKGWASNTDIPLTIFLPRDSIEMEITWRIILLAYRHMTSKSNDSHGQERRSPTLPKYASAAKYWM